MLGKDVEALAVRYYDELLRYGAYRLRDRVRAEDMVQEVFLRCLTYAPPRERFSSEAQIRAYLYRMATNLCRDMLTERPPTEALDETIAAENDDGLSLLIEDALARLPDSQREAAVLYYFGGFRVREIAAMQGVTASAVKSRLKAARDTLRVLLGDRDETTDSRK